MSKDLYVRQISPDATEEDLRKLFAVSGKVTYVHMVKDAKSGEFVGCAFVKMSSEAEAKDAIVTLDGALLVNRTISVIEALPQKPRGRQKDGDFRGSDKPRNSNPKGRTESSAKGRAKSSPKSNTRSNKNSDPAKGGRSRPR